MAITWLTPTDITPATAGSWQDADVSGSVPAGATGVILHIDATSIGYGDWTTGWRKNGSTDSREGNVYTDQHFWAGCGVDSNRVLELYVTADNGNKWAKVWLVGYFTDDAVFFTNAVDKSLGATGSWIDIDISSDTGGDTAIGAILEIPAPGGNHDWGVRKNGSSDNRAKGYYCRHTAAIIGVDGSEIFEGQISNTDVDFFLVGYITEESTFLTNATDLSLGATGSWIDLSALPAGATGGFIEAICNDAQHSYGLRENGSAENFVGEMLAHQFGMVEADGSRLIEGQISNTAVDFFLVGYSETAVGALSIPVAMRTYRSRRAN